MTIAPLATLSETAIQPRARGRAFVRAKRRGDTSVIDDLHQQGSLKVLFPRAAGNYLNAVLLNCAGGITGGDRFRQSFAAGPGTHMLLSTQAAERVYRAQPGETGTVRTMLDVARGARIDWLPQETILFDRCALRRSLDVNLAPGASALVVEPLVLGRTAMGETLGAAMFGDRIDVRRDGALVYTDRIAMNGPVARIMAGRATGLGAAAMATVLLIAPDAESRLEAARAAIGKAGGASLPRPGILAARLLAADGFTLRAALIPLIAELTNAPLPRPWTL